MKPGETAADVKWLDGVLVLTGTRDGKETRRGFAIKAQPAAADQHAALAATPPPRPSQTSGVRTRHRRASPVAMWQAMLFALLGGLILNLMPCVLPILSLKALTLAEHAGSDGQRGTPVRPRLLRWRAGELCRPRRRADRPAQRRAGVRLGLPIPVAGLRAGDGRAIPGAGAVAVGRVRHRRRAPSASARRLTQKGGSIGSFFTGVLATVAATPCTAPFMGVAVGYALTRPAPELGLVMLAMGLGFALPVLALSLSPTVRALLPRPGPWMQTFRQVLAFPLYATVAWLVWVLSLQTGSDGVLGAGVTLIAVGFAAWLAGSGGGWLRGAVGLAVVAGALALTVPWLEDAGTPQSEARAGAAASEPFSEATRRRAARRGAAGVRQSHRSLVHHLQGERARGTELQIGFSKALADHNIAYLKGDWTSQDEGITHVLKSYGRAGVPLYLLYPADPSKDATVLPQLLTEAIVVRHFAALDRAQAAAR